MKKNYSKVLVAIPTSRGIRAEVLESLALQSVHVDILVEDRKPKYKNSNPWMSKSINSTYSRNILRKRIWWRNLFRRVLFKEVYTHILFLDDDIVLPFNGVEEFLKQKHFDVMGGWVKAANQVTWVPGAWIGDATLCHFAAPWPSVVPADFISVACVFIKEKVLKIPFKPGIDSFCRDAATGNINFLGPSVSYSNSLFEKDIKIFVNGSVIAEHLSELKSEGEKIEEECLVQ